MKTFKQHHPTKHINNNQLSNQLNKNINKMVDHHPVGVRVKLLSNRATMLAGRESLAHVLEKQSVKDQARVKLNQIDSC